jgi:hypothetical protein
MRFPCNTGFNTIIAEKKYLMRNTTLLFILIFSFCFSGELVLSNGISDLNSIEKNNGFKKNSPVRKSRSSVGSYNLAIGICGSLNAGLSVKHYILEERAIEIVLATRWRGISLTALYEACISSGDKGPGFIWNFGIGPRFGFYNGEYFRDYLGKSREFHKYSMIGVVGTFGFEYYFKKAPISAGLEYRPFFDLKGDGDSILDGAVSLRYVF